jgi:predicted GNAT family N-acyltransferase
MSAHVNASTKPWIESSVEAPAPMDPSTLRSFCREVRFAPGDKLRLRGQHYHDMYLITDGAVSVHLGADSGTDNTLVRTAGYPIGEIGFLRGCPATATVAARTAAGALVLDDAALARLEKERPALGAQLLRYLAETAEERTSWNLTFFPKARTGTRAIDVYLCRNATMLESAQKLRYDVYCVELGRNSPYADHEKKIITDALDAAGQTLIAVEAGETIGTLRANLPSKAPLGVLEELYGMRASRHHPDATSICTKFIVKRSRRGSAAAMMLIAAMVRYGVRNRIKECYIDCIPALLPYYKALGFEMTGPRFFHRENGPSYPMKIDLVKHGERLSKDFAARKYLQLYVKAKLLKWIDKLRGGSAPVSLSSLGAK